MQDNKAALEPNGTYHIFSRANGNEEAFKSDANYQFFLERYKQFVNPIAETFCYCLMPNHFHFLVRVRGEKVLNEFFKDKDLTGFQNLSGLLSKRFSNFLNSYVKAFNKEQNRRGSLFIRPYKRISVTNEQHRNKLVHYIHYNPIEAGFCAKPANWKYSSYSVILSSASSLISRKEVLEWFDDLENFKYCHRQPPAVSGV